MSNLPPPDPRSSEGWNQPPGQSPAQPATQQQPGAWDPPQAPPQQPYATPYSPQVAANPFEQESTPILVTGILSLVLCGPIGIYAWIKGNDLRNRATNAGWPEPSSAKVGRILGIVGTIIFGISIIFFILWFVFVIVIAGTTATTT
jgi:hypothetical protein